MRQIFRRAQTATAKVRGKRTYIVSLGFIVVSVIGWTIGAIDTPTALEWLLEGCGFSALRAGLPK